MYTTFFKQRKDHNVGFQDQNVQFFETVIRYLGGLLSSYALTGDQLFLNRADELGQRLLPVFDTPHGLPTFAVNMKT